MYQAISRGSAINSNPKVITSMSHLLSLIKTKGKVGAFFAFAALLTSAQLFAQTVNTATVTRPAGLVLSRWSNQARAGAAGLRREPAACVRR